MPKLCMPSFVLLMLLLLLLLLLLLQPPMSLFQKCFRA